MSIDMEDISVPKAAPVTPYSDISGIFIIILKDKLSIDINDIVNVFFA